MTSSQPLRVAVIVSSTREGRRGRALADWVTANLSERAEFDVDEIDLADVDLPERLGLGDHAGADAFRERLTSADAFVVITPEYNHSYPASLKHAIDLAKPEWKRKVVGFVSYGGVSGGLRAVEHLRQVFAELHSHSLRDTVSFHGPWNGFADDGTPSDLDGATAAMDVLASELVWWGEALRVARAS